MDADFWHDRWQEGRINFHEAKGNKLLATHFEALGLAKKARVFIPLSGKTRDIDWLLFTGFRVVACELSPLAIEQLFEELQITPTITERGPLIHFAAPGLDVFVGDVFDLSTEIMGPVDAVYDRAAVVALPSAMRADYAAHVAQITAHAPQLVISFEYDQSKIDGPPFSVDADEMGALYDARFDRVLLERTDVPGGLKGFVPARECAWLLRARQEEETQI